VSVQEFLASAANDSRRSTKTPLAPATRGLKGLMQKLGGINARHEALVRRVDELEVIALLHACQLRCCRYDTLVITGKIVRLRFSPIIHRSVSAGAFYTEPCIVQINVFISYGRVVRPSIRLSVCLSVHHTLALCQNDAS